MVAFLKRLATAAAAIGGFAIACIVTSRFFPAPQLPHLIREKTAYLAEHGNEYDAIFLGSSRIQNHVIPSLFDGIAAGQGLRMKSFNFGVSSLRAPEDDYLLDLILARPHARLRWVFIEIDFFQTDVAADQDGTLRGVYWHDFPRFALLCRRLSLRTQTGVRRNVLDAMDRWHDFQRHALLFCQNSANSGRGAQSLENHLFKIPPAPMDWESLGEAKDGWLPAIPKEHDIAEQRSGRLGELLKERREKPPLRDLEDSASQSILTSMLEKITNAGATPIIVIPPRARQYYYYPAPALAERFPMIDLCSPAKYPDLYRDDLRVDSSHLTAAGAEVFTRLLADHFFDSIYKP